MNTQKTRVCVDIETLGTKPGSVILSIGAVKFNREGVTDTFYRRICPKSCQQAGLVADTDTMMWWLQQSESARADLVNGDKHLLAAALLDFKDWTQKTDEVKFWGEGTYTDPVEVELWGNGANFDNNLLGAAYDACGLSQPWKFFNDRCYRTVKALHPDLPMQERTGTHHNALDDARSQALHLITLPSFQAMCDKEEAAT